MTTLRRRQQAAVLNGRDEVVLDEALVSAPKLEPNYPRLPPHLEVGVRVHACSLEDLQRRRFRLES
ncbi:lantibiotic dehydratase [Streptomyces sp. NBC_01320]|uniref:lantibiotic dehydratase n=1 Tax=Streptomyces sp. NBC_01320 TaxID=2903824 RepID=UPI003FA3D016